MQIIRGSFPNVPSKKLICEIFFPAILMIQTVHIIQLVNNINQVKDQVNQTLSKWYNYKICLQINDLNEFQLLSSFYLLEGMCSYRNRGGGGKTTV